MYRSYQCFKKMSFIFVKKKELLSRFTLLFLIYIYNVKCPWLVDLLCGEEHFFQLVNMLEVMLYAVDSQKNFFF